MTQEPTHVRPAATVTPYENGPLLLRGDFEIVTPDGERIEAGRSTVALCRCGRSRIKPFCDGTHKLIDFRAPAGRQIAHPDAIDTDQQAAD
ncbi:CDGSH iron-sulfur domain-containing protein [Catellatospora sp. NPDC049609]|uniref:CDGSH iron-sulfur domain-containing protein n=1 Tax=Catellatospora sp. NPDC049609 TaxID=3155505 RepID=UPI00341232E9